MKAQRQLIGRYLAELPAGTLQWIGLRPERKQPMECREEAFAIEGCGLEGDHRCAASSGSARQVTIISQEYIGLIAHFLGRESISPQLLRRNLVVSGINLSALRYQQFVIGEAIFEATALCHPCSRMEKALGKGAVAAMLGHGGLCASICRSGIIRVGDQLSKI